MMKRFLIILCVVILSSCGPSSTSWDRGAYSSQAVSAPSKLTRDSIESPEPEVYSPYNSPAENDALPENEGNPQTQITQNTSAPYAENDLQLGESRPILADTAISKRQQVYAKPALPPVKVALLLPLSGEHSDLGQAMLQAAQLALFDMGYDAFELMPRDTRGTAQGSAQAAQSAVTDGAQLILGPLFAGSVQAAKPITQRYGINMIAFSTDWSLAGGHTYIMGFLPFSQVQRVAEYAASNGFTDIGILAPNSDYGNAVIAAYNSMAYRTGLRTADVARFSGGDSETSTVLREFTQYDYRVQQLEEMQLSLESKAASGDNSAKAELAQISKMQTWGEPPFSAVLLPVGGDQARSISNLLSFYDLGPEQVKRLGTGLWDDSGLATEPALEGAWFAAPSPDLRRDFENRYRDLYGLRPQRLATLSYDATALAAVIAKKSFYARGRVLFTQEDLMNPNGFAGIDGIFRFRPDGLVERGLAVLEYADASIKVVDPAPTTFQSYGY